jgi:hypothetical protein
MDAPTAIQNKQFEFIHCISIDPYIEDYAKMAILFAFNECPNNDFEKCRLIVFKFQEKYGPTWSCSIIKEGNQYCQYFTYFLQIKFEDYTIYIWKSG